jgi:hypothetical protein
MLERFALAALVAIAMSMELAQARNMRSDVPPPTASAAADKPNNAAPSVQRNYLCKSLILFGLSTDGLSSGSEGEASASITVARSRAHCSSVIG